MCVYTFAVKVRNQQLINNFFFATALTSAREKNVDLENVCVELCIRRIMAETTIIMLVPHHLPQKKTHTQKQKTSFYCFLFNILFEMALQQ